MLYQTKKNNIGYENKIPSEFIKDADDRVKDKWDNCYSQQIFIER